MKYPIDNSDFQVFLGQHGFEPKQLTSSHFVFSNGTIKLEIPKDEQLTEEVVRELLKITGLTDEE